MTVFGADISHYQGAIDFEALVAAGCQFLGIKAWEHGQADSMFGRNRDEARRSHMAHWGYAFLHDSDTDDQITACIHALGGTVLALDWEAPDCSARTVERWMEKYESICGRQGLAYYGLYPPQAATARIGEWPRWFPEYANASKLMPWNGQLNPDWRECYAIWQFSSKVRIDGYSGDLDADQLAPAIPIGALEKWLDSGTWPPIPELPEIPIRTASEMQLALLMRGYSVGPAGVDGIWGP